MLYYSYFELKKGTWNASSCFADGALPPASVKLSKNTWITKSSKSISKFNEINISYFLQNIQLSFFRFYLVKMQDNGILVIGFLYLTTDIITGDIECLNKLLKI